MPKKILNTDITGERGVNLIQRVVLEMGCLWYATGLEAGIDGVIEIRDPVSQEVTNRIIQVQSKATAKAFLGETASSLEFLCDENDLRYWLDGNAPVVLIVSRPETNEAYWVSVKDYFADPQAVKGRRVRFDKVRDRFDRGCWSALVGVSKPKDSGLYIAPLPRHERIYSNLLPVALFAERLYIATTDYRSPGALWKCLRDYGGQIGGEWFLKGGQIFSFRDLREYPWTMVCDEGTVEEFDAEEWAFSNDMDQQRDFVQLLNRTLKEALWKKSVLYNDRFDMYCFRPTENLTDRRISYRSQQNNVQRTVFQGYPQGELGRQPNYYRHSGFHGRFQRAGDEWYLEIEPTYYYTQDGELLYKNYERLLDGMKKLENNSAVLGQLLMWGDYLSQPRDLFSDEIVFLEFLPLQAFELDAGLDDASWLKHEEAEKASGVQSALDDLGLFEL